MKQHIILFCLSFTCTLSMFECDSLVNFIVHNTLSQKNDTDVAHYNFNARQPISVIFGRGIA